MVYNAYMKTCKHCGSSDLIRNRRICRGCQAAYNKQYHAANRDLARVREAKYYASNRANPEWVEAERKRQREYWRDLRLEVMDRYGGRRCACCGETELTFLSIDHVNNDGAAHRRALGYKGNGRGGGSRTMLWLKTNGFPPGFQVLCFNCNHSKHVNNGTCAHKLKRLTRVA